MTTTKDTTTMAAYHNHLTAAIAYERIDDLHRDAAARRHSATRAPRPRITRRRPTWWTAVTARTA